MSIEAANGLLGAELGHRGEVSAPAISKFAKFQRQFMNGIEEFKSKALTKEFNHMYPLSVDKMVEGLKDRSDQFVQDAAISFCLGQIPRSLSGAVGELQDLGLEMVQETRHFGLLKNQIRDIISSVAIGTVLYEGLQQAEHNLDKLDKAQRRLIQISVSVGLLFSAAFLQDTLFQELDTQSWIFGVVAIGLKFVLVHLKTSMKNKLMARLVSLRQELILTGVFG